MGKANITKSILSITSPGTNLDASDLQQGRTLARQCNEFAADLKRRHPDKFGFWASLPLPDVEGSLVEMEYAFDVLDADGIAVLTNSHGVYLGNALLDPIFEALNKRGAKVFIHPTSPCLLQSDGTARVATPLPDFPAPMFEFFFDTSRAIINMFVSGTVSKSPCITVLVCHAGGALTPLVARFTEFATSVLARPVQVDKESVIKALQSQFFFDIAGFVFPEQIQGLLCYVDASRITYGSDYPYTPEAGALKLCNVADEHLPVVFPDPEHQHLVWKGNALNLTRKEESIA